MYAIIETRFDIAFIVFIISQFVNNPMQNHVAAVKHIFCYLKKNLSLGIIFSFYGYIDSDEDIDPIICRSTIRYFFTIAGDVISALSKRQYFFTLSLTKAQYVAYCQVTKETV